MKHWRTICFLFVVALSIGTSWSSSPQSPIVGKWKFKSMDVGAMTNSPQGKTMLERIKQANPSIEIKPNHRFLMRLKQSEEGAWKIDGKVVTFAATRIGGQSIDNLRKEFAYRKAKDPQLAKRFATEDPFAPLTATLASHGKLLIFKSKQSGGGQMVFEKAG